MAWKMAVVFAYPKAGYTRLILARQLLSADRNLPISLFAPEKLANILRMLHCDWSTTEFTTKMEWTEEKVGHLLYKVMN